MDSINIDGDLVPYFERILVREHISAGTTFQDNGSVTFEFPSNNQPPDDQVLQLVEEAKQQFQNDQ